MILRQKNGLFYFQFPNLLKFREIWHGVFMRHGGLSPEPYRSLNVSFGVGDTASNVKQNRDLISRCIAGNDLIFIQQVHQTHIHIITRESRPEPATASETAMTGDSMITDLPRTFLAVKLADCQSVLLYDPIQSVVANVHAGWRGSIQNILGRTVQTLKKKFGCLACHIHAGISPSLGPCCATFIHYRQEIPENFWSYKDASDRFDFWAISRKQLCDAGVLDKHVVSSDICTQCNTDHFFSHRGEGVAGRFASVIGIRGAKLEKLVDGSGMNTRQRNRALSECIRNCCE